MTSPDAPRIHPDTSADWRRWLAENHNTSTGIWFVRWTKASGRTGVGYEEAVIEALAYGWVDSKAASLDADRTLQWFGPRKPGSGWARTNKVRIAELERTGRMAEPGARLIQAAKDDGSWTLLDDVEDLVVPPDLAAAFDAVPGSFSNWQAFPPSSRRAMLVWLVDAKRPQTRADRVGMVADKAGRNERAK